MLNTVFSPQSTAVIGTTNSEGKLGYAILHNIIQSGFRGAIYPINPGKDEILGNVTPIHEYEPNTWGRPPEADRIIAGDGGWHNPMHEEAIG
jgi:hypothetical protein